MKKQKADQLAELIYSIKLSLWYDSIAHIPFLKQVFDTVSFWDVEDSDKSPRCFNAITLFPISAEAKEETVWLPLASAAHILAG